MVFNVKMDNLFNNKINNLDNQYSELTKGGDEDLNIYTFSPINSYDVIKEGGEDGGVNNNKKKLGLFGLFNKVKGVVNKGVKKGRKIKGKCKSGRTDSDR